MATDEKAAPKKRRRMKLDNQLDAYLAKRNKHLARIEAAKAWEKKQQEKIAKRFAKMVGKSPAKVAKLDKQELPKFLRRAAFWLRFRHGPTIKREAGTVLYREGKVTELEMPADLRPAIAALRAVPDGAGFLVPTVVLDVDALKGAPPHIRKLLKPYGFKWGRRTTVSVKSPADDKSTLITRWLRPEPKAKSAEASSADTNSTDEAAE